jgi:hypothetical protein
MAFSSSSAPKGSNKGVERWRSPMSGNIVQPLACEISEDLLSCGALVDVGVGLGLELARQASRSCRRSSMTQCRD